MIMRNVSHAICAEHILEQRVSWLYTMKKMRENKSCLQTMPTEFQTLDELQWQKEENHDKKISKKKKKKTNK